MLKEVLAFLYFWIVWWAGCTSGYPALKYRKLIRNTNNICLQYGQQTSVREDGKPLIHTHMQLSSQMPVSFSYSLLSPAPQRQSWPQNVRFPQERPRPWRPSWGPTACWRRKTASVRKRRRCWRYRYFIMCELCAVSYIVRVWRKVWYDKQMKQSISMFLTCRPSLPTCVCLCSVESSGSGRKWGRLPRWWRLWTGYSKEKEQKPGQSECVCTGLRNCVWC